MAMATDDQINQCLRDAQLNIQWAQQKVTGIQTRLVWDDQSRDDCATAITQLNNAVQHMTNLAKFCNKLT